MKPIFYTLLIFAGSLSSYAQDLKGIQFLDPETNQQKALTSLMDKGVVLIFSSLTCPYDQYYRERILTLHEAYGARGIKVVMVNSNTGSGDSAEEIKKFTSKNQWPIPYLIDTEGKVASELDIAKSSTALLIGNRGGKYSIQYTGSIDSNALNSDDVQEKYLEDALNNYLSGQPIDPKETQSAGCRIR